ncbi:archaeal heat shock protein Hsp20 [Hyalangium gracile]|uniref:archaeal heat shock protein Hsp20 n=1 Tax=Hyalangium gracile TaxID=394092 RepID=UPI001CCB2A05|nr:archaeal heat shock protein Hsp20 [Hyalangium gracile]
MFRSLGGFMELLSELAEKSGGEFTHSEELGDDKKGVKAVYGFSVRVGGGGKPIVEKFGNVQDDGKGPVVEEVREPMVDQFDEGEHLLIVAELPGVDTQDIHFELKEDVLLLSATRGERKYRKEVLLSAPVQAQAATSSYRNGVFELKLPKAR